MPISCHRLPVFYLPLKPALSPNPFPVHPHPQTATNLRTCSVASVTWNEHLMTWNRRCAYERAP